VWEHFGVRALLAAGAGAFLEAETLLLAGAAAALWAGVGAGVGALLGALLLTRALLAALGGLSAMEAATTRAAAGNHRNISGCLGGSIAMAWKVNLGIVPVVFNTNGKVKFHFIIFIIFKRRTKDYSFWQYLNEAL